MPTDRDPRELAAELRRRADGPFGSPTSQGLREAADKLDSLQEELRLSVPLIAVDCLCSTLSEVEVMADDAQAIRGHVLDALVEYRRGEDAG